MDVTKSNEAGRTVLPGLDSVSICNADVFEGFCDDLQRVQ